MKKTFMDLLSESTIFQGMITLAVISTWSYLMCTNQPPPEYLNTVVGVVIGFFFGGKYVQAVSQATHQPSGSNGGE